ncbi:hypothetical protein GJ629_05795 [Halapricum sp. CBA1109]|uniref:hypothetical protein n=1 Tax=Halapricum sp. CBA1109 TaxID=2668068 RepID=UPI0012FA5A50|nr:hypothetical protein [Halapricum sp. CBA1109]MUV89469.1 hypothetical protein [Halapricum sp. CBA1109]
MGDDTGLRGDEQGNLLVVGAVILAVLLLGTTAAITAVETDDRRATVDSSESADVLEAGIEAELSNATVEANATATNRTGSDGTAVDITATGPANATGGVRPEVRAAVARTFDGAITAATERRVARLVETVADQQGIGGEMTAIEPTDAGVEYGVRVTLGTPDGRAATSGTRTRTDVIRTVSRENRTYTRTTTARPGPNWTRGDRRGSETVVTDTKVADSPPGPSWERVAVLERSAPDYRRTTNVSRPGPEWERVGPNGTVRQVVETTVSTDAPGPAWRELAVVDRRSAVYDRVVNATRPGPDWTRVDRAGSTTVVRNVTTASEDPGPEWDRVEVLDRTPASYRYATAAEPPGRNWTRTNRTGTEYRYRKTITPATVTARYARHETVPTYTWERKVRDGETVARYGRFRNVTTYDWRRLEEPGYVLGEYERTEDRPVYEWTKTVPRTVTELEEIELDAEALAPTDDPVTVLSAADGMRDSSVTVATDSLPIGPANATELVATATDTAATSDASWRLSVYRDATGRTVVETPTTRTRTTGSTVHLDLESMTADGGPLGMDSPAAAIDSAFDLSLVNGSGVYGSYSLFAANASGSDLRSVENITVTRAIDTVTFDVTQRDTRTTYTDTVTVEPDHDRTETVVVESSDSDSSTARPPDAAVDVTRVGANATHAVVRLDASATTADALLTGYDWRALAHSGRVHGLRDDQRTQRITVERAATGYYLPVALTVTDANGYSDAVQGGVGVPGTDGSTLDPGVAVDVDGLNDTHARLRATSTAHSDTGRYDFRWEVTAGERHVTGSTDLEGGRTVEYTVERQDRDTTVAVELAVTDTETGESGTAIGDATVPAIVGIGSNPFEITLDERSRTARTVTYRLRASGAAAPTVDWREIDPGRAISGLRDGPTTQTITVPRRRTDYRLAVEGTDVGSDGPATDTATVTVPSADSTGDPSVTAVLQTRRTDADTDTETWLLRGSGSFPASAISSYDFDIDDSRADVTVTASRGARKQIEIDRPDSDSVSIPVELTVSSGSSTSTDSETITVDSSGGGGGDPITSVGPDAELSITAVLHEGSGAKFRLDASGSNDPDGEIVDYRYSIETSDTVIQSPANEVETNMVFERDGAGVDATVTLTVQDDDGNTDSIERRIWSTGNFVGNKPPRASLSVIGAAEPGEYTLDPTNSSDPDGRITSYEYEVITENGELLTPISDTSGTQNIEVDLVGKDPDLELRLTVTDDGGLTNSTTASISDGPREGTEPKPEIESLDVDPSTPTPGERTEFTVSGKHLTDAVQLYVDGSPATMILPESSFVRDLFLGTNTYSFSDGGVHNVTAYIKTAGGSDSLTKTIQVNRPPEFDRVNVINTDPTYKDHPSLDADNGYWSAAIDAEGADPDDDSYSISADAPYSPLYSWEYGDYTTDSPSGLTDSPSVDIEAPVDDETLGVEYPGIHNVTVRITDEHGATTTETLSVGEQPPDKEVEIDLYARSGTPSRDETVYLSAGESVPIDYGVGGSGIDNIERAYFSIEVTGPNGVVVHEEYDDSTGSYKDLNFGLSKSESVSSVGTYTVKARAEAPDGRSDVDRFTFDIKRPKGGDGSDDTVTPEQQWNAEDPGDGWESTGDTRTVEKTSYEWVAFDSGLNKLVATGVTNGYDLIGMPSYTGESRTVDTETDIESPGSNWEKVEGSGRDMAGLSETVYEWEKQEYKWEITHQETETLYVAAAG